MSVGRSVYHKWVLYYNGSMDSADFWHEAVSQTPAQCDAMASCGPLLTDVERGLSVVCVRVLDNRKSYKTAEPTRTWELGRPKEQPCIRWGPDRSKGRSNFSGVGRSNRGCRLAARAFSIYVFTSYRLVDHPSARIAL